jgi:hypothetical protein
LALSQALLPDQIGVLGPDHPDTHRIYLERIIVQKDIAGFAQDV